MYVCFNTYDENKYSLENYIYIVHGMYAMSPKITSNKVNFNPPFNAIPLDTEWVCMWFVLKLLC